MTFAWRTDAPPNQVQLAVGRCLIDVMDSSRWTELGLLTDKSKNIDGHHRLLRSLSFGDDDYYGKHVYARVPVLLAEQHLGPAPGGWWCGLFKAVGEPVGEVCVEPG